MILKSPAMRISFALVLLTVNLHFVANLMGLGPDDGEAVLELRKSLSESLAIQFSAVVEDGAPQTFQRTLRAVVERNHDIRSAAIRTLDGKLLALTGEHLANWKVSADGKSTATHVQVPVFHKDKRWATVEIRFASLMSESMMGGFHKSYVGLLIFISASGFLCYFFVLKRTFRELDPTAVIPDRVQRAFDVLQEGVLILDEKEQIVMVNAAFSDLFGKTPNEMIGLKGSELGWQNYRTPEQVRRLPWFRVMQDGQDQHGVMLRLANGKGKKIKLAVNATVVSGRAEKVRGTLLTFDDITELEEKNFQLTDAIEKLQLANREIEAKSLELKTMADCDPLTLCLNRRSLARKFDILFNQSREGGAQLSCLMADIDFFKSVNDNHGHAVGDQVIKAVADVLKTMTRDSDLVGRYGGEEFCVLLPKCPLDRAFEISERIRKTIEAKSCSGVSITVSMGVSTLDSTVNDPDELIDQADKALYSAKKGGRNRVVAWGVDAPEAAEKHDLSALHTGTEQAGHTVGELEPAQLLRRVAELEGLLEKRGLELKHLQMYDAKTGMPTRSLFEDRIEHELARARRKNSMLAVLCLTVDTISRIDETLGHRAAEQLVKACGQRLNSVLRRNLDSVALFDDYHGMSSVSLTNQTEFSILLTDIKQVDHVTWVMKRLLDTFNKPFQIKGNEIFASACFGVGIYPHDGKTVDALCRNASNACHYACEKENIHHYLFASKKLNQKAVDQLKIENMLHKAIRNDELQLYYQPKIEAGSNQIAGFEALLRWQNDELGFVSPGDFIPVAEQTGQIDAIGDWVLSDACRQIRAWLDMGLEIKPVAINLSGIQLRQPNLAAKIWRTLDKSGLRVQHLEIELTESSLVNTFEQALAILKQIKAMGFAVTMDDFGTGYSSLSYLRDIPLTGLKVDRSFIKEINKSENANKLIDSIVSMAHGLGLEVVAEGVEDYIQAKYLVSLGCEYLQGYYFSRPVPAEKITEMLHTPNMSMAS